MHHNLALALPKAELHVHLVGAASPSVLTEVIGSSPVMRRMQADMPEPGQWAFRDFAHFCESYGQVSALLSDSNKLMAVVEDVSTGLIRQGVRYAEVTVTPLAHLAAGLAPDELSVILDTGRRSAESRGLELAWVCDFSADGGVAAGHATIDWLQRWMSAATVGFGIGGPESSYPRRRYAEVFDRARALGLHCVPHAGETTGVEEVRDALDFLHARRIGHGIAAVQSRELSKRLVAEGVALEVCPTSNLRTGACVDIEKHPLPRLLAAGVPCTLASDDPGFFGANLLDEVALCSERMRLGDETIIRMLRWGIEFSFASAQTKHALLAEFDAVCRSSEGHPKPDLAGEVAHE